MMWWNSPQNSTLQRPTLGWVLVETLTVTAIEQLRLHALKVLRLHSFFWCSNYKNDADLIKYLVRDIKPQNHESCFPQFFSTKFPRFEETKKKINFSLVQNWEKKLFWTNKKFLFLFQLLKLRKFRGTNWGKQDSWFGGLMSRTR